MVLHQKVRLRAEAWCADCPCSAGSRPYPGPHLNANLQMVVLNESPVFMLLDPVVQQARHKDLPVLLFESGEHR